MKWCGALKGSKQVCVLGPHGDERNHQWAATDTFEGRGVLIASKGARRGA